MSSPLPLGRFARPILDPFVFSLLSPSEIKPFRSFTASLSIAKIIGRIFDGRSAIRTVVRAIRECLRSE